MIQRFDSPKNLLLQFLLTASSLSFFCIRRCLPGLEEGCGFLASCRGVLQIEIMKLASTLLLHVYSIRIGNDIQARPRSRRLDMQRLMSSGLQLGLTAPACICTTRGEELLQRMFTVCRRNPGLQHGRTAILAHLKLHSRFLPGRTNGPMQCKSEYPLHRGRPHAGYVFFSMQTHQASTLRACCACLHHGASSSCGESTAWPAVLHVLAMLAMLTCCRRNLSILLVSN